MTLEERLDSLRDRLAAAAAAAGRDEAEITLCAATKTQSAETVQRAIAAGITVCGENRIQEMTQKLSQYAYDGAALHFIGHLQTNKVHLAVGRCDLIESVDSLRLLEAVDKQARKLSLVQDILLEVNIAGEESKGGVPPQALPELALRAKELPHVRLRGLMTVPPISRTKGQNRPFFAKMYRFYVDMRDALGDNRKEIDCLSMGMSADFEDAVLEGATQVRLGSALFGPRG